MRTITSGVADTINTDFSPTLINSRNLTTMPKIPDFFDESLNGLMLTCIKDHEVLTHWGTAKLKAGEIITFCFKESDLSNNECPKLVFILNSDNGGKIGEKSQRVLYLSKTHVDEYFWVASISLS